MLETFVNTLIVTGDMLQTILNLIFVAAIVITCICLLTMVCNLKRINFISLKYSLYINAIVAYLFLYNEKTNLIEMQFETPVQVGLFLIAALSSFVTLLALLLQRPIEGGAVILPDGETQLAGKEYVKYFKKKKRKKFFFSLVRDILMTGSFLITASLVPFYEKYFDFLSNISINGAVLANFSIYTIILVSALIVVAVIGYILEKLETLF